MSIIDDEPIAPRSNYPHTVKHVRSHSNKLNKFQERNDLIPQIAKIDHLIEKVIEKVSDREEKRKSKKMEEIYELEIQRKKLEIEELKAQVKMKKDGNKTHEADPLPVTTLMKHYVQTINPFTYQLDMPPMGYPPFGYPPFPYSPFAPYQNPYPYPYPSPGYPYPQQMPPKEHKRKHKKKKYSDTDDDAHPPEGILIDDSAKPQSKGTKNPLDSKNSIQVPSYQRIGTIKTLRNLQKQDSIKTVHEGLRQKNESVYPRKEMEKTFMVFMITLITISTLGNISKL
jgi:hypothetical protein